MNPGSTWEEDSSYSQQNLFGCIFQLHQLLYELPKFQIIELFSSYLGPLHDSVPSEIPGSEQSRTWSSREHGSHSWEFAAELPSPPQPFCSLISREGKKSPLGCWIRRLTGRRNLVRIVVPDRRSHVTPPPPAASASPASCLHRQEWEC